MREVIKQAATVDEAIELALRELALTREQVTCEVLEYPGRILFRRKPAKVITVLLLIGTDHILQGCTGEEVLLLQS